MMIALRKIQSPGSPPPNSTPLPRPMAPAAQDTPALRARFRGMLGRFPLDVAFEVPGHGFTGLFGPSGCGKTTVLRCVAGLERLRDGHLTVNGEVWQSERTFRPPHKRAIGYVFQEASLFAHLTVRGNLTYGLKRSGQKRRETPRIRFEDVVDLLGLSALVDRSPARLSGGERQRVAIGRALLSQPTLLLMDEPLSALDRASRDEILPYFDRLQSNLAIPVLYVSHDLAEIERLADHVVLLDRGTVQAAGPLADVQADPASPIAHRADPSVGLDARVASYDAEYGLSTLAVSGARLTVPGELGAAGSRHRVVITATDVSLARRPPLDCSILNAVPGRVVAVEAGGEDEVHVDVAVRLGTDGQGDPVLARITRWSWDRLGLAVGERVFVQVKAIALAESSTTPGSTDANGPVVRSRPDRTGTHALRITL